MRADQRKRGKAPRRVPLKRRDRRCLEDQARGSKPEEGERRRIGRRSRHHREQHGRAGVLITARGGGKDLWTHLTATGACEPTARLADKRTRAFTDRRLDEGWWAFKPAGGTTGYFLARSAGTFGFIVDFVVYPHSTSMWGHACAGRGVERLGLLQLCKWLLARDNVAMADWLE
jgi:hypothetical protein